MKTFFLRLLGFGAFTALMWVVTFFACSHSFSLEYHLIGEETNWGYTNLRSNEWVATSDTRTDAIFLGSSTCYSGINPKALEPYGLTGFNFCSSAQNVGNSSYILKAVLDEVSPKFVILDVYPLIWGAKEVRLESTKDWVSNSNLRGNGWSKIYRQMAWESQDLFTLVQTIYYDVIRPNRKAGSNPDLDADVHGTYRGLGWVERTFPPIDSIECETKRVELSAYEANAIKSIRQNCEKKGVELIILNPPQLCEEEFDMPACFAGLSYIDGNQWPGAKTPQNYYDDHHLVGSGARQYSDWLASKILEFHHAHP